MAIIYYLVNDCSNLTIIKTGYPNSNFKFFERENCLWRSPIVRDRKKTSFFIGRVLNKSQNPFDLIEPLDLIEYEHNNNIKIVCIEDINILNKLDVTKLKGIYKRQPSKDYKYAEI